MAETGAHFLLLRSKSDTAQGPTRLDAGTAVAKPLAPAVVHHCVRPYSDENTTSRPICEVKHRQAQIVLGSVMTREP